MKAMILAAGFGTRLRPLTDKIPKPLLPILDRPIIDYSLKLLKKAGISDIIINVHYLADILIDYLKKEYPDGRLAFSREKEILGTGGGVKNVCDFLGPDDFVLINADVLIDIDIAALIRHHQASNSLATLVLKPHPHASQYGAISVDADFRIREFLGKMGQAESNLTQCIFTGVQVINPQALQILPPAEVKSCIIREMYWPLIKQGTFVNVFLQGGYWNDIGTPQRYFEANIDCLKNYKPAKARTLLPFETPPNYLSSQAAITGSPRLGPNVILGRDAQISGDVTIANSVILPGTTVGESLKGCICYPEGQIKL